MSTAPNEQNKVSQEETKPSCCFGHLSKLPLWIPIAVGITVFALRLPQGGFGCWLEQSHLNDVKLPWLEVSAQNGGAIPEDFKTILDDKINLIQIKSNLDSYSQIEKFKETSAFDFKSLTSQETKNKLMAAIERIKYYSAYLGMHEKCSDNTMLVYLRESEEDYKSQII